MLELVVFICGAVVMIIEMVGSRVLAPTLGTSIVVWTSLIGIILACLSFGYWYGGKLADRKPTPRALAVVILLAAFCVAGIAVSKVFVMGVLQQLSSSVHAVATLATLILFAPPSVLLGMVSPYAVRLKMNDLNATGRTVGRLYAISTAGSIFGTFLAGFVLIATIGSTNILLVMAAVLAVTSLLASRQDTRAKVIAAGLFILSALVAHAYDSYHASLGFHDVDTPYNRILVYNTVDPGTGRPVRTMVTDPRGRQSAMYIDSPVELAVEYTRFYRLAEHFRPGMKRALMLGGGGYSFPKYAMANYPDLDLDVVELDHGVTEIAREFFALADNPRLHIHHEDARTFINRAPGQYDVIFGDTFNSHYSIPFHLSTIEAVRRLHDLLDDRGIVLMNILSGVTGDGGRFLRAELATFQAVFPQVYLFAVRSTTHGEIWQNFMLLAMKSDVRPSFEDPDPELGILLAHRWEKPVPRDLPVLTDDFAPVDRYALTWN